jgi:hypothetical protein
MAVISEIDQNDACRLWNTRSTGESDEALKREVLNEYGGNGIENRSVLEAIEWAIDHIASLYTLTPKGKI